MKIKELYHKITCFLGFHGWQYSYPTNGFHTPQHHRTCTNCLKLQRYDTKGSNICNSNIWMDHPMSSTNHTFFKKIACKLGFHKWNYDHPNQNIHRLCINCLKEQEYIITNGGMDKIWIDCQIHPGVETREYSVPFNTVIANPNYYATITTNETRTTTETSGTNQEITGETGLTVEEHQRLINQIDAFLASPNTLTNATTMSQVSRIAEVLGYSPQPNSLQFVEPKKKKYRCDLTKLPKGHTCIYRDISNICLVQGRTTLAISCIAKTEYKEPEEKPIQIPQINNPITTLQLEE